MNDTQRPKLAALAVVAHEGKVLLVKRSHEPDAGLWGYPGGHVECGETALEAASRELQEETGVEATPIKYLTNLDIIRQGDDGEVTHHFLLAAVLCQYQSGSPFAQDDVSDARWFDYQTILNNELPTSKDVDNVLRLALEEMG